MSSVGVVEFRTAMSQLAGAVTVIAVGSPVGRAEWRGMTATAVCSLSPEPPSLLVCLNRLSGTYRQVSQERMFSVNVLTDRHLTLAHRFAGQEGVFGAARFDYAPWESGILEVPVLADALVSFECRVEQLIDYGTHGMLICGIGTTHLGVPGTRPLIYHDRQLYGLNSKLGTTGGAVA